MTKKDLSKGFKFSVLLVNSGVVSIVCSNIMKSRLVIGNFSE